MKKIKNSWGNTLGLDRNENSVAAKGAKGYKIMTLDYLRKVHKIANSDGIFKEYGWSVMIPNQFNN